MILLHLIAHDLQPPVVDTFRYMIAAMRVSDSDAMTRAFDRTFSSTCGVIGP